MTKKHKNKLQKQAQSSGTVQPKARYPEGFFARYGAFLEKALLGIYLFLLPWFRLPDISSHETALFFVTIWIVTAAVLVRFMRVRTGDVPATWSKAYVPALIWIGVAALSAAVSFMPFAGLWGAYTIWSDGLLFYGSQLVLAYLAATAGLSRRELAVLVGGVIVQASLVSLSAIRDAFAVGFPAGLVRPSSSLQNSDFFLVYALAVWPLALSATFAWRKKGLVALGLTTLGFLVISGGLFLSLPIGLQQMALRPFKKDIPVILARPATPVIADEAASGTFLADTSNSERFLQWRAGTAIGKDRLVLGAGPGNIRPAFFKLRPNLDLPGWNYNMAMDRPHSDLIERFALTGALGVLAYVGMWLTVLYLLVRGYKNVQAADRPIFLGLAGGILLSLGFAQALFVTVLAGVILAVWTGLSLGLSGAIGQENVPKWVSKVRVPAAALIGAAFLVASFYGYAYVKAERSASLSENALTDKQPDYAMYFAGQSADGFPANDAYQWLAARRAIEWRFSSASQQEVYADMAAYAEDDQLLKHAKQATLTNLYNPVYAVDYGITQYMLAAKASDAEKQGSQQIEKGLAMIPKYADLYVRAGDAYATKGDFKKALELYTQAKPLAMGGTKKRVEGGLKKLNEIVSKTQ